MQAKEEPCGRHPLRAEGPRGFPEHKREHAREQAEAFFEYYGRATSAGRLTEREKALIALTVATVRLHCRRRFRLPGHDHVRVE